MRRITVGITLFAALGCLLALPLTSSSSKPRLADTLRGGIDRTLTNVNTVAAKLREQQRKLREAAERERRRREAARRRAAGATPRAPSPGPQGTAYTPPLHGDNPHGQGTVAVQDLPPTSARPLPAEPKGSSPGEILVAGRARGEQLADGTYHGHITIAGLLGAEVLGVNTTPGQTEAGPLDPVQTGLLTPICNATANGICLSVLTADSATTATGSTNKFSIANAAVGGPTGINAGVATSNGNISEDANCQTSRGDSNVADATVGGLSADAIEATSTSVKCKDGTQSQTNTSKVVNLQNGGVALPPLISQLCANGAPDTPALIGVLAPAVCNADESNSSQAGPVNGNREGLTAFVLDVGGNALTKTTTASGESRAVKNAQCSDGKDNDGDGKIDFPADPGCTSVTDDDETDSGGEPECSDGRDNDGDGRIDFPADPGCSSARDDSEAGGGAQCADGRDNDGDGKVDFPDDPGCSSARDDSEAGGGTECSDGRDNDGDGKVDFPDDPGCSSARDDSEADGGGAAAGTGTGGGTECSDGIDNDNDGKTDFPDDPGCSSAADDSEGGNGLAFTGTNVLLAGLLGSLLLLMGLGMRAVLSGRQRLAPGQGPGHRLR